MTTMLPRLLLLLSSLPLASSLDNGLGLSGPAMGWSSWNHFGGNGSHGHGRLGDVMLREIADAIVSSGLAAAGFEYVNLDDGWAIGRHPGNGSLIADPELFPFGIKAVADYIHSRGLKFGIYTARGSTTCMGRPASDSHETIDAQQFAKWGVDYLKEDSCGGTTHGTVWEQYSVMRDALNATGRQIWYSITQSLPYVDDQTAMHCYGSTVFTTRRWTAEGLDPTTLANSYLVEYCNNQDKWGATPGDVSYRPGGFLSQLDSQQLLTWDNLTVAGAYNDMDMLENCNGAPGSKDPGQSVSEYRAQFTTFAMLTSPLILGNDPRNMTADCLEVITNREVIALARDTLVSRARLVHQFPDATWPNKDVVPPATMRTAPRTPITVNITVQVWAKPMADGSTAVVVLNRGAASTSLNVTWAMLGLPKVRTASVRDLWLHLDMGLHEGGYLCHNVPPHDVVALRVTHHEP